MLEGGFLVGNSLFCNRMSCFYRQWLFEFLCFLLKHEIYRDFFEWRLSFRETINAHISYLISHISTLTSHLSYLTSHHSITGNRLPVVGNQWCVTIELLKLFKSIR